MPIVTIEVRRSYSPAEETGLIDAVHAALVEGLQIPEWDKTIRFIAHEPHRFTAAPGKGDRYTLVSIDLFAGRSLDAKRRLYRAMVTRLAAFDIPADHVKVALREIPRENWGLGGVASCDMDVGFEIQV